MFLLGVSVGEKGGETISTDERLGGKETLENLCFFPRLVFCFGFVWLVVWFVWFGEDCIQLGIERMQSLFFMP